MTALSILQGSVHAQDDWIGSSQSYLCKSGTEVREVRSYWREESGPSAADALSCRVDYLKAGTTQTLWTAHHGRAYCEDKATALVDKLMAGGEFRCERLNVGEVRRPR